MAEEIHKWQTSQGCLCHVKPSGSTNEGDLLELPSGVTVYSSSEGELWMQV